MSGLDPGHQDVKVSGSRTLGGDASRQFHEEGIRAEGRDAVAGGASTRGAAPPLHGEYQAPIASFLQEVTAAKRERDHLLYSSVTWRLGQELINRQEYGQAAECFRCVLRSAEVSSNPLLVEAARMAGRLCVALGREQPAGNKLEAARTALGKDLLRLSREDVSLAEAALAEGAAIPAQPHLRVRFFGRFEVSCNDQPLSLRCGGKAITILRYLLANRSRPVTQDYLMDWLWPESEPRKARWSLNSAIYTLRKLLNGTIPPVLPFDYILLERGSYHLASDVRVSSDTDEFDARCNEGYRLEDAGRTLEAVAEYEKATELYRGDFLVEEIYEEWTLIERERLADAHIDLLSRLADHYAQTGQARKGIRTCYRVLRKDPSHEESHRLLMECFVRLGQRGRALRQYKLCEQALRYEYDMAPSPETQALYRDLLKSGSARER